VLWTLVFCWVGRVVLFGRRREDLSQFAAVDNLVIVQVVVVMVTAAYILCLCRPLHALRHWWPTSFKWLLVFYAFAAVSALWSPLPIYSLYRTAEVVTLGTAVLLASSSCTDAVVAERRMLYAMLIIGALQVSSQTDHFRSLMAYRSNSYPAMGTMIACYSIAELLSSPSGARQRLLLLSTCLGIGMVVIGQSTTSNIATMAGLTAGLLFGKRRLLPLVGAGIVLGAAAMLNVQVRDVLLPGKPEDYDVYTASGRTYLWEDYREVIARSPLIGVGYDMLPRVAGFATNSHNSFLAVLGGTGAVGLACFLAWVFRVGKECVNGFRRNLPGARGITVAFLASLINSLSIAFLGEHMMSTTIVFVCLLAYHYSFLAGRTRRQESLSNGAAARS
jgi:O-antigen ligase